jgi:hypothetical protein
VEHFINESEALSLCAELCKSLKRLELKRSSSGERPTFGRSQYHHRLNLGSGRSIRLEWLVERNNKPPIDAFELATECIAEGQIPSTSKSANSVRNSSTCTSRAELYCGAQQGRPGGLADVVRSCRWNLLTRLYRGGDHSRNWRR